MANLPTVIRRAVARITNHNVWAEEVTQNEQRYVHTRLQNKEEVELRFSLRNNMWVLTGTSENINEHQHELIADYLSTHQDGWASPWE